MPIYEYQCESCSYKFEVKQSIKDDPIATCERCGKPVRRLISSPAIMFKGSGWYITDYSDKMKPPTDGEKAASASGEKKDTAAAPESTAAPAAASSSPAPASTTSSSPAPASNPAPTTPSSDK